MIPKAIARICHVCKTWKDLIYDTPKLWRIISLDLLRPIDEIEIQFDQFASRAKWTPVDLYLFNFHQHYYYDRTYNHPSEACASTVMFIRYFISHVQNLRKLQVIGHHEDIQALLTANYPPKITIVRELVHCSTPTRHSGTPSTGLSGFLRQCQILLLCCFLFPEVCISDSVPLNPHF